MSQSRKVDYVQASDAFWELQLTQHLLASIKLVIEDCSDRSKSVEAISYLIDIYGEKLEELMTKMAFVIEGEIDI